MKILVVDDELISREKMRVLLRATGECELASTGEEAIALFADSLAKASPYSMVTLDISMPGMGGLDVLRRMRQVEQEKGIAEENRVPIVMVTSESERGIVVTCLGEGCNDYLLKPFDKRSVAAKIGRFLV